MMFAPDEDIFEIRHKSTLIHCERMRLPGPPAFHVVFSSTRAPLVVTRALDNSNNYFWTSVPEGRQSEAEGVGRLIEDYFDKKDKRNVLL